MPRPGLIERIFHVAVAENFKNRDYEWSARTVDTEPDFACDVMLPITKPHPRPFKLAKLAEPFLRMLRTETGFARTIIRGGFPSATCRPK
jgi:hypothetical protein